MILRCPGCNGALEYDAASAMMYCGHCGNFYRPEQINNQIPNQMQNQQANPQMQGHPMMNYKQQMGQMNQMNQQVNPGMPMGQMSQMNQQQVNSGMPMGQMNQMSQMNQQQMNPGMQMNQMSQMNQQQVNSGMPMGQMNQISQMNQQQMNPGMPMGQMNQMSQMNQQQVNSGMSMGQMNQMNQQQVNTGMPMGQMNQMNQTNQMNQGMQVRQQAVDNNYDDSEYMESKVYTCTACGAELMINNVETSTFCAYCGQPTIVFNRVSKCRRPRYIIPFSVTKDQALSIIRQNLSKGDYVPDEVKNFKVEMLRGIYIPFWLFDIRMRQRLLIRGQVGTGDDARTAHFYRDGEAFFNRLTVDASVRFNDESSQRLEPYIVSSAVPFNEAYLSGFYADCGDDAMEKMDSTAVSRASNMLSYEIRKSVRATEKTVEKKEEIHQVSDRAYALLPAWFLVFKNDNQFYTLMVNGQTGKMIGAVPSDKNKVTAKMTSLSIIFAILGGIVGLLAGMLEGGFIRISAFFVILIFTFFGMGNQDKKAYERSKELTTEKAMKQLVAERNGD